jgi:hypothetical protein
MVRPALRFFYGFAKFRDARPDLIGSRAQENRGAPWHAASVLIRK